MNSFFRWTVPLDRWIAVLTSLPKEVWQKACKKLINVALFRKNHEFFKKNLLWKCLYGHLLCSFDNLVGKLPKKSKQVFARWQRMVLLLWKNFFTKIFEWTGRIYFSQHRRKHFDRKCSAQHRKLMKKCLILTERKSFFGIFWWTRRSQFRHKPVKNLIAKVQQFSRNVQKRWIMCTILSMKFFSQIVVLDTTMIALLTNPLKKVPTKRQKLSLPMRICYNTDILVNRKNSLELFLWTRRGQFWQPRWKEIDKRPKKFRSMTGNAENLLIFFFSLSNIFCRHVACSFDNAAEKKFRKARKVSPIVRKW